MKTSNRILLSLFVITIATLIGSNYVLSEQLKNFDFVKSLNHYIEEDLPSFSAIHLKKEVEGSILGYSLVEIKTAEDFQIKISNFNKGFTNWEVKNDTLFVIIRPNDDYARSNEDEITYKSIFITISVPKLKAIQTTNIDSRLLGFQGNNLDITLAKSKMKLDIKNLDTLYAKVDDHSILKISGANQIQKATLAVKRHSSLTIFNDFFQSLEMKVDDSSSIQLPGSMFNDFTK